MQDEIFKADAKQVVDICFDQKLFKEEVTRDDMITLEDLICYLLQSRFESYKKASALCERMKKVS